jgi:DivIVA domain-containing protein
MISEVSPSVITIPSWFSRMRTGLLTGSCTALAVIPAFGSPTQNWLVSQRAAYLAAVASVAALLTYRGWHTGVRFDTHGLTIRYFFWTRRLSWQEVSRFAAGRTYVMSEGGRVWALDVVRHDGRAVTVKATARPDCRSAAPKVLTAVLQAAEWYGIPAALTEPAPSPEAGRIVLSEWAASRDFPPATGLQRGYDGDEVDAVVEAIRQTFLGIRQPPLTADEIRHKQFSTTRLHRGYDIDEVDAFLEAVELRLAAVTRPEGHGGLLAPAKCPECGMETADPTRSCARCGAPAAM